MPDNFVNNFEDDLHLSDVESDIGGDFDLELGEELLTDYITEYDMEQIVLLHLAPDSDGDESIPLDMTVSSTDTLIEWEALDNEYDRGDNSVVNQETQSQHQTDDHGEPRQQSINIQYMGDGPPTIIVTDSDYESA